MVKRDKQFKILLSQDEHERLLELAESRGLTASDYIRMSIREAEPYSHGMKTGVDNTLEGIADLLEIKHGKPTAKSERLRKQVAAIRGALGKKKARRA